MPLTKVCIVTLVISIAFECLTYWMSTSPNSLIECGFSDRGLVLV